MWPAIKDFFVNKVLPKIPQSIRRYLKKTWVLWLIVLVGFMFLNVGQFVVLLALCSALAAVLLVADKIIDPNDGWGLFPDIDIAAIVKRATETPLSCAVLFLSLCCLLTGIMLCAAMVLP